jgi:uncharacterized membrane protein
MSFLSGKDKELLKEAIAQAEGTTSGEVVLSICKHIKGDAYEEAKEFFKAKGLYKTALRNGVLIRLAYKDHKITILGDEGINAVIPEDFWEDVIAHMVNRFRQGDYTGGLQEGILMVGEKLQHHFPHAGEDDINELGDDIHVED